MRVMKGDLVLISFPFSDMTSFKVRPAIIISNNELNGMSQDCILIPLTSVIKDVQYSILLEQNNMLSGNLIVKIRVRVDKIVSIKQRLIKKKIGVVKKDFLELLKLKVSECL